MQFRLHESELVLTDSSDRNHFDFFLVRNDIHVNQTLQCEAILLDIELSTDQLVNLGPVVGLELGPTERCDDRHGTAECLDQLLELSQDWIVGHGLLKSADNLGVFGCLLLDNVSLDPDEAGLELVLGVGLPVTERSPHEAPIQQVFSEIIQIIEDGARCLKRLLPRVVGHRALFQFFKRLLLIIKLLYHFVHVGGTVKIGRVLRLVVESLDLLVELGNEAL